MSAPVRFVLGAVVVVFMGVGIIGIGMGDAPSAKDDPAPTSAALQASKAAVARGGEAVRQGEEEFAQEGCGRCHAIAATGAKGALGPRLDTQAGPVGEIAGNIIAPRKDIRPGYEDELMPTDYGEEMTPEQVQDVAKFLSAASAGSKDSGAGEGG